MVLLDRQVRSRWRSPARHASDGEVAAEAPVGPLADPVGGAPHGCRELVETTHRHGEDPVAEPFDGRAEAGGREVIADWLDDYWPVE